MGEPKIHDMTGQGRAFEAVPQLHAEAQQSFERMLANYPEGMAGYAMFAVNSQGEWSVAWRTAPGEIVGPTLLAALVKEAATVEITVDRRIRETVVYE